MSEPDSSETSNGSGDPSPVSPTVATPAPDAATAAAYPTAGWGDASSSDDERSPGEMLKVDVEGFEGPLDLLLALARTQKVDLAHISMVALVDQYLAFIAEVQKLRLELAADYLVMAAWLAFLKSRLLLPREDKKGDEPTPDELAARIAFRLMRLDAMRKAAAQLFTRKRLGRDVFARGMPEGTKTIREREYSAEIFDLIKAYAEQRKRTTIKRAHVVKRRTVMSIKDARTRLERLVGASSGDWFQLDMFIEQYLPSPEQSRTAIASSFGASLEMAREGMIDLRQAAPFAPIYMRRRETGAEWEQIG
ncbi:MAG: segregation and condensation protein A [Hyphomicrobiaceae bacterium]